MNRMAKKIAEYTQRAKAKQDFSSSPSDFNDALKNSQKEVIELKTGEIIKIDE